MWRNQENFVINQSCAVWFWTYGICRMDQVWQNERRSLAFRGGDWGIGCCEVARGGEWGMGCCEQTEGSILGH